MSDSPALCEVTKAPRFYDRHKPKPPLHGGWEDEAREHWHAAEEDGSREALAEWAARWGSALVGDQGIGGRFRR